ncbi:ABC transporter substrate-binding protein [Rhodovibrionaceae bacterium A322]
MDKKELNHWLQSGRISRRDFMLGAAALGFSATWAGKAMDAHAATPKKGGTFRYATAGAASTDSLDPATFLDTYPSMVSYQISNCLVELDADNNAVGELAESIEPDATATVWRIKLRKGVEFHNGKTLDADDVIYSLQHHLGEKTESAAKSIVAQIKEMKADGKNEVIFTLSEANADLPYFLSDYHLPIFPAGTTDFSKGIGTGGYILEEFEPGVRTVTRRNPNYWKEDHANFDAVISLAINDPTARQSSLLSGEVDAISDPSLKTLHFIEKRDGVRLIENASNTHMTMPMLEKIDPMGNHDVQMALKYAIDREQLVKNMLRGHGVVGNDTPIGPVNSYRNTEMPQRAYDPDKAAYHWKKAGMEGKSVELHAADLVLGLGLDTATTYQQHAKGAGIDLQVVRAPSDGYWSDVWLAKPWCQSYYSGRPTEDMMFSLVYTSDGSWNETGWANKQFDQLVKDARGELDTNKRRQLYHDAQALCNEDCSTVIPFFLNDILAVSDKVQTKAKVAANYTLDGMRAPERWWFNG